MGSVFFVSGVVASVVDSSVDIFSNWVAFDVLFAEVVLHKLAVVDVLEDVFLPRFLTLLARVNSVTFLLAFLLLASSRGAFLEVCDLFGILLRLGLERRVFFGIVSILDELCSGKLNELGIVFFLYRFF